MSCMRVVVRSDHEELVESVEEGLYHLERHDSLKSQVCRTSIRRRPGARRISPRSSFDAESFARGFGCSRERCTRAVMRFSSSARSAHVEVAREGVRSRARGPAHPVDGSQPRSWARMIFPNGKSDATSEGSPAPARPHVPVSAHGAIDARAPR